MLGAVGEHGVIWMNAGSEPRRSPTRTKRMMQIGQCIQMKSTSSVHGHATQTIARLDPNQSRSKSGQPLRECKLRLDPRFALPRKEISCSLSSSRRYDEIVGKEGGVRVRSSLHQTISAFCPPVRPYRKRNTAHQRFSVDSLT